MIQSMGMNSVRGLDGMKKVVVVGGGSGTFNVLKGLKHHPVHLTAIVTAFDNGGSSGILRDEFGTLPAGDVRRCLVALAPDEGDATLRDLFNYRFKSDSSLRGHSFGNLFLQALTDVAGNEVDAIERAGKLLGINGVVLPVSTDNAHLCAELENGEVIKGETNIDIPKHDGALKIKRVFLSPDARINPRAAEALEQADLIVFGPGDLYSSIIPNMLVKGFSDSVVRSCAKTVMVVNAMTKWGETNHFKASDFVRQLLHYLGLPVLDALVYNASELRGELVQKYAFERAYPVIVDEKTLHSYAKKILHYDVVSQSDVVRHDAQKLSRVLVDFLAQ